MVKKVLSFFLATMLMMSVLSVSAATGEAVTSDFDGDTEVILSESNYYSYDDGAVWQITNSNAQKASYYSCTTAGDKIELSLVPKSAGSTDTVLQAKHLSGATAVTTSQVALGEGDTVYTFFKLRIPTGTGTGRWVLGAGSSSATTGSAGVDTALLVFRHDNNIYSATNTMGLYEGDALGSFSRDVWYDVVLKVSANAIGAYVYGEDGIIASREVTPATAFTVSRGSFRMYTNYDSPQNFAIQLNDSKRYVVSSSQKVEVVSSPNSVSESLNVNPSFLLEFDQPVNATGITMTPENGEAIDLDIESLSPTELYVTPANDLSKGENYTLSWAGVTGMAGNALAEGEPTSITYSVSGYNPTTVDYKDGFDDGYVSGGTYVSNVWQLNDAGAGALSAYTTMNASLSIQTEGFNRMMEISRDKTGGGFRLAMNTANKTIPEGKTIYGVVKFMIPVGTQLRGTWYFGVGQTPLIKAYSGQDAVYTYETPGTWNAPAQINEKKIAYGSWNTVVIKVTGTTASAWLYDENGNVVQATTEKTGSFIGVPSIFHPNDANNSQNLKMYLDDSRYMMVASDNTMELQTSTIAANATDVELLDQVVDLKFDMPIADSAVNGITLNGEAVTAVKTAYDSVRVTLPSVLVPNTPYTLSFANVTGLSGNSLYGAKSLSFTTKASADDFIVEDLEKLLRDGCDVAPGQQITVANVGAAKEDVDFIVAFYSSANTLIGAQWVTDVDFGAQAKAQLQLANDGYVYRGVYGIRVFAFTADSELKPVFSGATYGNLWD